MRYKHYSISGKIILLERGKEPMKGNDKTGYLITEEYFHHHQPFFSLLQQQPDVLISIRGTHKNLATCAHNLFDHYHFFDKAGVKTLFVEALPEVGIGYAIMNRVRRSAA
jgi:L-threonylcarbamoyladenylate synthase